MALENHVRVVTLGKRLQSFVDGLLVALVEEASVTMRCVPNRPIIGVCEVVAAMPREALEISPIAGQFFGGIFNARPVDAISCRHDSTPRF
jgi:hypothetical protein